MQQDQEDPLYAEQVSRYLRSHPQFFEQHAHLLTEIFLPSPHGNGTISLTERQQLAQRDKIRVMESKMAQMIAYAEQNDKTSGHVHQFSVQLLASPSLDGLNNLLAQSMQDIFAVSHSQLLIWQAPSDPALAQDKLFSAVSSPFQDWVSALSLPHCGENPPRPTAWCQSPCSLSPLSRLAMKNRFMAYSYWLQKTQTASKPTWAPCIYNA